MKKFYAILLGLALTLGLASVASAAFTISGQFVVAAGANWDSDADEFYFDDLAYHGDTRFEVKLTGAYGPISGDATFRFKKGSSAEFRSGKIMYKLSDELSFGVVSSYAGTAYYASPVDGGELKYDDLGWGYLVTDYVWNDGTVSYSDDWTRGFSYDAYAKAELNFGDFKADIFATGDYANDADDTDFNLWVFGDLEYAMDPFTFYLPFSVLFGSFVDDDDITMVDGDLYDDIDWSLLDVELIPAVKFAISDELYVAGEVAIDIWSEDFDGSSDSDAEFVWLGLGVDYESDALHVYGSFDYHLLAEEIWYYIVGVEYDITDAVQLYAEYEMDEYWPVLAADYFKGLTLGVEWNMDGAEKSVLVVEFVYDDYSNESILAKWTLKF